MRELQNWSRNDLESGNLDALSSDQGLGMVAEASLEKALSAPEASTAVVT